MKVINLIVLNCRGLLSILHPQLLRSVRRISSCHSGGDIYWTETKRYCRTFHNTIKALTNSGSSSSVNSAGVEKCWGKYILFNNYLLPKN